MTCTLPDSDAELIHVNVVGLPICLRKDPAAHGAAVRTVLEKGWPGFSLDDLEDLTCESCREAVRKG